MTWQSALKWGVFTVLVVIAATLFWWPSRPAKIELLPFTDSPPAWDGSFPHLIHSHDSRSSLPKLKTEVSLVQPTTRHDSPVDEFDVDLHSGRFVLRQTDLFVQDVMPVALTRTYITWDNHVRAFGVGGNHPYDICPTGTRFPYTYMDLNLEDGYQVHMPRASKGTGYADAAFRHSTTSSEFYGVITAWNGDGWSLTFRDGRKFLFPEAYYSKSFAQGAATEMDDSQGHRIQLRRDKVRNLKEIVSPGGHTIRLQYDAADRIVEAEDDAGHVRKYSYDAGGHLETVSDGTQTLYQFEYQRLVNDAGYEPWLLTAIVDGKKNLLLRNRYWRGRVSEQALTDGKTYHFEYDLLDGDSVRTTLTLPSGDKKIFFFRDGHLSKQE